MRIKVVNKRITPAFVTELSQCEVFVFGSNLQGMHGGGAARIAYEKFGAVWGEGDGPTGRCYAIPTMHGGIEEIRPYAEKFIRYAKEHPMKRFLLTRVGCGIAGFRDRDMAPLFAEALDMPNITLPKEWLPYVTIDITLGLQIPKGRDKAPKVITDEILKTLCSKYLYEIGAGIDNHLPEVHVRYVLDNNEFGYTTLENCFFFDDGDMYVWEADDKWQDEHNQEIVEEVFGDECHGRGFAHRVIFAGVSTGFRDSNGEYIYTGDVIRIGQDDTSTELALGAFDEGYCFILDNHCLFLNECRNKILTRIGTVFFQLDWSEYPVLTVKERTMQFNGWRDTTEEHKQKVLMAKFTPNFDQEEWKYIALDTLGVEYHWNK